jgi:hypothetical protein
MGKVMEIVMETGVGAPGHENQSHRTALAKEERQRKLDEATRMFLGAAQVPSDGLAALAELVKNPQATSKRIAELQAATRRHDEAAAAARLAAEKLQRKENDFAVREQESTAKVEREQAEHAAWLLKERSEIEHERAAVAQLKVAAESDAKKAAELKTEMQRRMRVMEGSEK